MNKILNLLFLFFFSLSAIYAQEIKSKELISYGLSENIPYRSETDPDSDDYVKERCRLDIYYPENISGYPTVVWFHGGGLSGGNKFIPDLLKEHGVAVVAVNYRLYPKVKCPVYIDDAAAAVAWVFKHIAEYGGDQEKILVSGHSAGGYLTLMIGLDKSWLAKYEVDADRIKELVPFSGHAITHFVIRKENGIPNTQPVVDRFAPLFHVRADAPLLLLVTGDRELEILGRYEENAYLSRMMKITGHPNTTLYELDGFDHGGMAIPAFGLLLKEINRIKNNQ